MPGKDLSKPRCAALVGPYTSGKTTLLEALLFAAGAIDRKGSVTDGSSLGDSAPEARARTMSIEPNFAQADYLGEAWSLIDCPGSVELAQDAHNALMAADVAIVVAEPDPAKALALAPLFRFLERYDIPHVLFVNKMDKASVRVRDLLEALQAVSPKPLVLRQVPIREGEEITGFVDLVSERAYKYVDDRPSELIQMPEVVKEREADARQEMLESLADFDDGLLEQLLEDKVPAPEDIYAHVSHALHDDLLVPVLLGSAELQHGLTRLWKTLRHDVPEAAETAQRLGLKAEGECVMTVVKTLHQSHMGKLSLARLWKGALKEGGNVGGERPSGLYRLSGHETRKIAEAGEGDLVALQRLEKAQTGDTLTPEAKVENSGIDWPEVPASVYALAIEPENRQDEVKLTASVAKLIEEDPSYALEHNQSTHQMLLRGQGEIHLKLAVDRLKSKFNVTVHTAPPLTAYKETIRKGVKQHSRFKRQSGGHGQFADVQVEIQPQARGAGFAFNDKIVGGAIPRNYIPAVEHGVQDYMERGPLGFPVVDVAVTLFDGQFHSVDSSDQAFRTAGRLAMQEGMPLCDPVLLEPIFVVTISVPSDFTAKIHGLVSGRRGQILGFEPKTGWDGWDELKCYLPQSEIHDLVIELRSLTMGVGSYEAQFDHLQELVGKLADKVIEARQAAE